MDVEALNDLGSLGMQSSIVDVLHELEQISSSEYSFWNVPRSTGVLLNNLVRFFNAKRVLEIGTSNGYSGIFFAEALSHNNGRLCTIESHAERFSLARQNFRRAKLDSYITQVKGHAPEVFDDSEYKNVLKDFDMVFIDGTKHEYERYLDVIIPLLKPNAVIVADNCESHASEVEGFKRKVEESGLFKTFQLSIDNGLFICISSAPA